MEQNKEPRNKPKSLRSINIWQRSQGMKSSKDILFNRWCWEIWTAPCNKMKLDHQWNTKINWRQIKDWNISRNTIKVLEENIGMKISDIPHSNILTDMSPKARNMKERINKWDLIKTKKLLHGQRKQHLNEKRTNSMGKHICQLYLRQGPDLQNI